MIAASIGDHIAVIRRQAARRGDKATLAQLSDETTDEFHLFVKAYLDLDSDRNDHLSGIKWTAFAMYATFYEFSEYERDMFMSVMPRVDNIVLRDRQAKAPKSG